MPPMLRRFSSLPSQVFSLLSDEISSGKWNGWMPGERSLAEKLQVSRKTLRKALAQLQREGLIEPVHGHGNRILANRQRVQHDPAADPLVVLLTPDPLEEMRPYTSLWVNHLKTLLGENGIRLHACSGRNYFSQHPARALEKLSRLHAASCWLLANSNKAAQTWFANRKMQCVIAGSCHPGIDLPHVDLDHYALCRHAAGLLLGAGHRRIALLYERSDRAGDLESEAGFVAGVRDSRHADAVALSAGHEKSPEHLCNALGRLLDQEEPPTALLVSNAAGYLTVVSYLALRGLRVPQDISVVSRDDDPFLAFLVPAPARYRCRPSLYAKKLLKLLLPKVRNEEIRSRSVRILPIYTSGKSLASPADRKSH